MEIQYQLTQIWTKQGFPFKNYDLFSLGIKVEHWVKFGSIRMNQSNMPC